MNYRRALIAVYLVTNCVLTEGATSWPCSAQLTGLPHTAQVVSETPDKLAVFEKIRSFVFPDFRLAGTPSAREIQSTLLSFDPLYEFKLAGRLAFYETALRDPKRQDLVTVIVDETVGDLSKNHPTQQFFMTLASHKPNFATSREQKDALIRLGNVRMAAMTMMAASALVQAIHQISSGQYLETAGSTGMYLVLGWLIDYGLRKLADRDIYGQNFQSRMSTYESAHVLDHQLIRYSSSSRWAYLSINMGPDRMWDLFSHWEPGPEPRITVVILGYGS